MVDTTTNVWNPGPSDIETAHVTALIRRLGVGSYDELHRLSLTDPERYWREVNDWCGIVWSKPWDCLVDTSEGMEFPRWFVGGRLNWTDTVMAFAADPEIGARPAIIGENEKGPVSSVLYKDLPVLVRRVAGGLSARGIGKGDRVGLLMETGVEALVSALAVAHIGAILVPLFSGFGIDAIVSRLGACEAKALIGTAGFYRRGRWVSVLPHLIEACRQLPGITDVIIKPAPEETTPAGWHDWYAVAAHSEAGPSLQMSPDDPFLVIFTSGTTGKPKGAVHTHGGFPIRIAHDSAVHFNVGRGDVFCWPADMGWVAGMLIACTGLMRGATLVCYDGAPDHPGWGRMGGLVERHRITHLGSAPTLIRGLAANQKDALAHDLSSLRLLITAGEVIAPEHFLWYQKHIGRGVCPVINYTGGTEASGALLANVVVKPIVPAGFNCASPGVDADVVDETGASLVGTVGELAIRAPFIGMTQAFWRDRERYLETYWRTVPGIWVHGDLVTHTADGFWFLQGRSDDTLKVAGKRLGPAEVEDVLLELPGIVEAAAIGVEDAVKGQKLVVFVVAAPGSQVPEDTLQDLVVKHVETRLGRPFRPERVHLVSQLPKTRASKIMRRLIRSVYTERPPGDLTALNNPESLDDIRATLARR